MPADNTSAGTRAQIQSLVDRYYEAFNALDAERVVACFTEDCVFEDLTLGRTMRGHDELAGFVSATGAMADRFRVEPRTVLIDGEMVAVRLTMSGVDPATGTAWEVPSSSTMQVRDGRFAVKSDLWNLHAVLDQIGGPTISDIDLALAEQPDDRDARAAVLLDALFGVSEASRSTGTPLADVALPHLFGEIWARPGLAVRDRSLATVSALAVLCRGDQLRFHLRGALAAGISPTQLEELMVHLGYYGGFPVAVQGLEAVRDSVG